MHKVPETWGVMRAAVMSQSTKLQESIAAHVHALNWRKLYRDKWGSEDESRAYRALLEEAELPGASDVFTMIPTSRDLGSQILRNRDSGATIHLRACYKQ